MSDYGWLADKELDINIAFPKNIETNPVTLIFEDKGDSKMENSKVTEFKKAAKKPEKVVKKWNPETEKDYVEYSDQTHVESLSMFTTRMMGGNPFVKYYICHDQERKETFLKMLMTDPNGTELKMGMFPIGPGHIIDMMDEFNVDPVMIARMGEEIVEVNASEIEYIDILSAASENLNLNTEDIEFLKRKMAAAKKEFGGDKNDVSDTE